MKFFVEPAVEIEKFELIDVITVSDGSEETVPVETALPYDPGEENEGW